MMLRSAAAATTTTTAAAAAAAAAALLLSRAAARTSARGAPAPSRRFLSTALRDSYEHILVERRFPPPPPPPADDDATPPPTPDGGGRRGGVGLITLNRPKALNALCDGLFDDLRHASSVLDDDDEVGCLVITGRGKAFAAGADISEMSSRDFDLAYKTNMFEPWSSIANLRNPTIAAVNGFALGGGCELAMMCDIVLASPKAKFGQPEINLGVIPGAGGTQRLVRAIGKSKAMEMVLTGKIIDAEQAERDGLVSRVVREGGEDGEGTLVEEAIRMGFDIASKGKMATWMAKEAVNAADELTLNEGLRFERRLFHSLFGTKDQKEGMAAFLEKRKPDFTDS